MLWQLIAATPSPVPSPNVNQDLVTPGVWGFAVTAAVMVAAILLILDMVRRMRRLNYRSEIRARLEAEQRAGADSEDHL